MWRALTTLALTALARGCEVALGENETFEPSEQLTPRDVGFFVHGSVKHTRLRMRKRKDLRVLRGKHSTVYLAGGGVYIDAPRELERWLRARAALGVLADGPLF